MVFPERFLNHDVVQYLFNIVGTAIRRFRSTINCL
jgi:hypothetical protein